MIFRPGHLVMIDIPGTSLDDATAAFIRRHEIRAVCLFRHNLGAEPEVRRLTADLREAMGPHALIGLDQEGGSVVRATFLPQPPSAMALGAIGDERLCEDVGAAVARGLRSLGVNWNFAPVVDVNSNPANPVVAERSFGEDPDHVTRLAAAWMRGSLREGVACCVKHFPGHGDTHVDSHRALPAVDKTLDELEALELRPFRALTRGPHGAPSIMTAHIVYPRLDPECPATLSRTLLAGLLRNRLGYDGVVLTDALFMKAVHDRYGTARSAVLALQAGADMPLAQGTREEQAAALEAIEAAIASGDLRHEDLERSRARLEAMAGRYPVAPGPYEAAQRSDDDRLMHVAWACGLTTFDHAGRRPLPPPRDAALRVVTQADVACDGVSEAGLPSDQVARLFEAFDDVQLVRLPDLDRLDAGAFPRDGRVNILVSNHRARYPEAARAVACDLHLPMWNPFQAIDIAAPAVVAWGYADGASSALKAWLEGRAEAPGLSPVRIVAGGAST